MWHVYFVPVTTAQTFEEFTVDPSCPCGCQIASSSGVIVSSPSCTGSSVWTISAPRSKRILLRFELYFLDPSNPFTTLQVRDGDSPIDDLLISDDGSNPPSVVESSGNKLRLELVLSYNSRQSRVAAVERFAASFQTSGEFKMLFMTQVFSRQCLCDVRFRCATFNIVRR